MREWTEAYLEDLAVELTVGHVGPMATEYLPEGIPFLRSQNVVPFRLDLSDIKYISAAFHSRLRKSALRPGDVVVVRTGKPGACAVVPESLPISNCSDLVIIRPGARLDSKFLCYYVNTVSAHHVNSHLVGAVQQHFNVGSARRLRIRAPGIDEQRRIGDMLGALDDKIDLNRHMNETLEALAQAIFKSWFVDFDPVHARMEGRRPTGMSAGIAKLFPDSFVDSPLGKIPKGWAVAPIGELVRAVGGSTPSTKESGYWTKGQHHWATPKDLSDLENPILLETAKRITDEGLTQVPSGLLPVGTVLLSSRAPIGYLAISQVPVAVNQGFIAMVCDRGLPNLYVLQWSRTNLDTIIANANGSTFLEISKSAFRPIPALRPKDQILEAFVRTVGPFYEKIVANLRESRLLRDIRDTLLPKLLSGELHIKDAEKKVEAAT